MCSMVHGSRSNSLWKMVADVIFLVPFYSRETSLSFSWHMFPALFSCFVGIFIVIFLYSTISLGCDFSVETRGRCFHLDQSLSIRVFSVKLENMKLRHCRSLSAKCAHKSYFRKGKPLVRKRKFETTPVTNFLLLYVKMRKFTYHLPNKMTKTKTERMRKKNMFIHLPILKQRCSLHKTLCFFSKSVHHSLTLVCTKVIVLIVHCFENFIWFC